MIVIFEGPDAAGKDVVRDKFEELTKYEHTCVTRFYLSQLVYSRYYKRPQWESQGQRMKMERDIKKFLLLVNPLIVYCYADCGVLEDRIRRRGEKVEAQPDCEVIKDLFEKIFTEYHVERNLLRLDTSLCPPLEELSYRIVGKIKSLEGK